VAAFVIWRYVHARNGVKAVEIGNPTPKSEGEGKDRANES
jgi:hypothetical protein